MKTITFYTPKEKMPDEGDVIIVPSYYNEILEYTVRLCWLRVDETTGRWDGEHELKFVSHEERPDGYILGTCSSMEFDETTDHLYWCLAEDFNSMIVR